MSHPDGWKLHDGRLIREFSFPDFLTAKAFVDCVSDVCELQLHHAEIRFGWGYVVIETYSHDVQMVTSRDFTLAKAINDIEVKK